MKILNCGGKEKYAVIYTCIKRFIRLEAFEIEGRMSCDLFFFLAFCFQFGGGCDDAIWKELQKKTIAFTTKSLFSYRRRNYLCPLLAFLRNSSSVLLCIPFHFRFFPLLVHLLHDGHQLLRHFQVLVLKLFPDPSLG